MSKPEQKIRFAILDPLRLLAAVAVVFYHYSIYFDSPDSAISVMSRFGYLGVNFFFILSGFVIMSSAQNRGAFEFALARALRIYPAFIICLLFTVVVGYFLNGTRYSVYEVLANASIFNDYLGVQNIDGVYWTLQAELKFYGCIFLLLIIGAFNHWRYWLSVWLLLAVVHYFFNQPFFMGWFINPAYSFYFIGGVCSYLMYKYPKDFQAKFIFFISLIFAFLTARNQASNFMLNVDSLDKNIAGVVVGGFFIFFALMSKGFFNIKKTPLLILLGAISYPLYLVHNKAGKQILEKIQAETNIAVAVATTFFIVFGVSYIVVVIERRLNDIFKNK